MVTIDKMAQSPVRVVTEHGETLRTGLPGNKKKKKVKRKKAGSSIFLCVTVLACHLELL